MELDNFNESIKKIQNELYKIPKTKESFKKAHTITKYANKLNKIAKKMNKLENISIRSLIFGFSHYLYNVIDDISKLFSKKKYKTYKQFLKNKRYKKWWIPIINHIRALIYIFTNDEKIFFFGLLLVLISVFSFFIFITS